jgi:hypothetical protein
VLGKSDGVLEQKQSIKMLLMKSGGRLRILTAAPVFLMQYILNRTIKFKFKFKIHFYFVKPIIYIAALKISQ